MHRAELTGQLAERIDQFLQSLALPAETQEQVRRFALVTAAGELVTHYGLTGWDEGEAISAARTCFTAWLDGFGGTGDREPHRLLEHVRAFFEARSASRFERINANGSRHIPNRAGFCRDDLMGKCEYLVLLGAFKHEICHGVDLKPAICTLLDPGWLTPDPRH